MRILNVLLMLAIVLAAVLYGTAIHVPTLVLSGRVTAGYCL